MPRGKRGCSWTVPISSLAASLYSTARRPIGASRGGNVKKL